MFVGPDRTNSKMVVKPVEGINVTQYASSHVVLLYEFQFCQTNCFGRLHRTSGSDEDGSLH